MALSRWTNRVLRHNTNSLKPHSVYMTNRLMRLREITCLYSRKSTAWAQKNLCACEECLVWTPKSLCPSVCKSMQLNCLLDFHKIWLRSSVKRFPASGGRHVTYGHKLIYNCTFNISWLVWVKFSIVDVFILPMSSCEFHEKLCSQSYTSLQAGPLKPIAHGQHFACNTALCWLHRHLK